MARCILCAVDDSTAARPTTAIAARLARDLDSSALLVHVMPPRRALRRLSPMATARARRIRRSIATLADENAFPRNTRISVLAGEPPEVLARVAEREEAELIVSGTGGSSTASDLLLGPVSRSLMRAAPCPVVVVPPGTVAPLDSNGMRAIACGVDGGDGDRAALWLATDLGHRLGGEVHAVLAYDPSALGATVTDREVHHGAEGLLAEILQDAGVAATPQVVPSPSAEALRRVAEQQRAGLVVPALSGSPGGERGSLAAQVAASGRTPVVVIPARARLEHGSGHYELVTASA